jgi:hypothetical protein
MLDVRERHLQVPTPDAMRLRPVDHRGFPVPWFVTKKTDEGLWDFVGIERSRMIEAIRFEKCWVSGHTLGKFKAFCIGPMCAINRTAGDPPTRKDIALWSVQVCPFMSRPRARRAARNEDQVSEGAGIDGVGILRNPGVTGVWVTTNSEYQRGRGFYLGDPVEMTWWAEGRPATRDEVLASVDSGIHHLEKLAEEEGREAVHELTRYRKRAESLWPAT